ncbi:MAG: hypothetical protein ACRC4L_02385 [Mycoplasma sp.]
MSVIMISEFFLASDFVYNDQKIVIGSFESTDFNDVAINSFWIKPSSIVYYVFQWLFVIVMIICTFQMKRLFRFDRNKYLAINYSIILVSIIFLIVISFMYFMKLNYDSIVIDNFVNSKLNISHFFEMNILPNKSIFFEHTAAAKAVIAIISLQLFTNFGLILYIVGKIIIKKYL